MGLIAEWIDERSRKPKERTIKITKYEEQNKIGEWG